MSAITTGFGTTLSLDVLDRRVAVDVDRLDLSPMDDGLAGSIGFQSGNQAKSETAPAISIGMKLEITAGGDRVTVCVRSVKIAVKPLGLSGTLGVSPETDKDLQQTLPLDGE